MDKLTTPILYKLIKTRFVHTVVFSSIRGVPCNKSRTLSRFSTRRSDLFARSDFFFYDSAYGIAFADVINDADKGNNRFARTNSLSAKQALAGIPADDGS